MNEKDIGIQSNPNLMDIGIDSNPNLITLDEIIQTDSILNPIDSSIQTDNENFIDSQIQTINNTNNISTQTSDELTINIINNYLEEINNSEIQTIENLINNSEYQTLFRGLNERMANIQLDESKLNEIMNIINTKNELNYQYNINEICGIINYLELGICSNSSNDLVNQMFYIMNNFI
jgi:hypothetical protein